MFAALAPRLATWFAVFVGCLAGGALAVMDATMLSATAAPLNRAQALRAEPEPVEFGARKPTRSAHPALPTRPAPQPSVQRHPDASLDERADTARPESRKAARQSADEDLIPSPHDSPVTSDSELRKAERLCIRDVPDECVRAADAYRAGAILKIDQKRAAQYRNLAFKAYIRLCEANGPAACYSLARMYLRGDGVKANPAYAKNLMRRVVEVCRFKQAEICERLEQEAPMPPKSKRRARVDVAAESQ